MRWARVGREAELASARAAVAASTSVVFIGPTGVGKSTLLTELATSVDSPRHPVIGALATEATRGIALSSFVPFLPAEPPGDPSMLLRSVLDQMCGRRGVDGLLVAIDDAQHLDASSMALLPLLMQVPDVCMAMTVNSDDSIPAGLRAVIDDIRLTRIDVGPLERGVLAELVRTVLGSAPAQLVDDLWRLSEGNPLIAREVLTSVTDRSSHAEVTGVGAYELGSGRLMELTQARLAAVPAGLRDALDLVAVGAPLPFEIWEHCVSHEQMSALHDANVVSTTQVGGSVVVRAAHPLYGQVLAAHIGEPRRRRACAELTAAAAHLPGVADPLRVAEWHHSSGAPPDRELSLAGARSAIGRHDGASAERLLRPVADDLDDEATMVLGIAMALQGQAADAEQIFAVMRQDNQTHQSELASARAFNLAFGLGRVADAAAVLASAADRTDDGAQRGRLDAERGVIGGIGGDFELALDASRATIDNPATPQSALASAYVSQSLAETMLGDCDAAVQSAHRGLPVALACRAEVPYAHDQIQVMEANGALVAGRIGDARNLVEGHLADSDASDLTAAAWLGTAAIIESTMGLLDAGLDHARAAVQVAQDSDPFHLMIQSVAMRSLLEALRGTAEHAGDLADLRRDNPQPRISVWLDRARAYATAITDPRDGANIARAGGLHAVDGQHVAWGAMALHDVVRLGEPASVLHDLEAAVESTTGAEFLDTMAAHARALCEESPSELGAVADRFAAHGSPFLAAEVHAQLSALHAARGENQAAARSGAVSQLWEGRCQHARTPSLAVRPPGLSARELQIAVEATAGDTSARIASRHVISVRTVDNHLGRTYRQLGVNGRDELAALLCPHLAEPTSR